MKGPSSPIGAALLAAALAAPAAGALHQDGEPPRLPLLADSARDATGEGLAFVEHELEPGAPFAGQIFVSRLVFGVEEELLRESLVQPFGARLEVPVQLVAPWLEGLRGAEPLGPVEAQRAIGDRGRPTVAVNGRVRRARRLADRVAGDRVFRVYEVADRFAAAAPGELRFSPPRLAFAYATRFEESLLGTPLPADRADAFVSGEPRALDVRPLPEEGRPWEFSGAVGSFSVRAEARPREIRLGESLALELTVEGEGDLASFDAPDLRAVGPFRVLGVADERTPEARVLTYELAPAGGDVREVPSVAFPYFDPGPPPRYAVARTEPIDVVVRAEPEGRGDPPASARTEDPRHPPLVPVALGLAAAVLAGALALALRRRRRAG